MDKKFWKMGGTMVGKTSIIESISSNVIVYSREIHMNNLAVQLNDALKNENPYVYEMLSELEKTLLSKRNP